MKKSKVYEVFPEELNPYRLVDGYYGLEGIIYNNNDEIVSEDEMAMRCLFILEGQNTMEFEISGRELYEVSRHIFKQGELGGKNYSETFYPIYRKLTNTKANIDNMKFIIKLVYLGKEEQ